MKLHRFRPKSLFLKMLVSHLFVVLITLLAVGIVFSYLVEKYFFSTREWELTFQAEKVAEILGEEFRTGNYGEIEKIAKALATSMDVKIRVIDFRTPGQGEQILIVAPQEDEEETKIGLQPNELEYVFQGNTLSKKVFGPEMQRLLVAIPVLPATEETGSSSKPMGAVTVSAPLTRVHATVAQMSRLTVYSGLVATAIAGALAFSLSKTISRPLGIMRKAARKVVQGNYQSRINTDATGELGELAATFNQAVAEMEKTIEEQKRLQYLQQSLVANVSHEFRAPLTSIQGFVEATLEGFVKEEEKEKYMRVILDNTLYLNRLVNDLMELSSMESGQIKLEKEEVSPLHLARRALSSIQQKAQDKNIEIEFHCEKNVATLWGDEDRLYQVLTNLLENAVLYTPHEGFIVLTVKMQEGQVIFCVKDSGIGIPKEDIPHIWERFYKVDKARDRAKKGQGLGLAIVKEIVRLHKGNIKLESSPGEGSTFSVSLPAAGETLEDRTGFKE